MRNDSVIGEIKTIAELRTLIPEPPLMMHRRIQKAVDDHCLTVIRHSSVCVVGFADGAGIVFINLRDKPVLRASDDSIDLLWPESEARPDVLKEGRALNCSLYFVMPGIGFTLRANGRCEMSAADGAPVLKFRAEEFFLHCSRAKVRANFWEPRREPAPSECTGRSMLSGEALSFISRSPYVLLLTQDAAGKADLSPRGDPDGFIQVLDSQTLLIPERPGNKVACTLTNIISHDALTIAFLIPGSANLLEVRGRCSLTTDIRLLERTAIGGKAPKIGMVVQVDDYRLRRSEALAGAGLWSEETHLSERDITPFPQMLSEHMNGTGLLGKATTLLVGAVVRKDLKNLY